MKRYLGFLFVVGFLLLLLLPTSAVAAQEETGSARVRIGYFAFDPTEYDTYIDGELAPFNTAFGHAGWQNASAGNTGEFVCCSATPFMDFPAGLHRFAFAPTGQGTEAAVAAPQEIALTANHVHSLVLIGEVDGDSIHLLNIDETERASGADLSNSFFGILVNDLAGTPPTVLDDGTGILLPYGQYLSDAFPAGRSNHMLQKVVGEPPTVIVNAWSVTLPPGLTDLSVISGTFPGRLGAQFAWYWNWGYSGPITTVDGGAVAPGDTVEGEIAEITQRVRYTLNLESDSTLNIYARTGALRTSRRYISLYGKFDPTLYVYDPQNRMIFWSDELSRIDDESGNLDAGLEALHLTAGRYTIEVAGGAADSFAGTYVVEVVSVE